MLVAGVCLPAGGKPYAPSMLAERINMLKEALRKSHNKEFSSVYEYLDSLVKILSRNARYYRIYDVNVLEEEGYKRVAIEFDLIERTIGEGDKSEQAKQRKSMIPRLVPKPGRGGKGGKEDKDTTQPYVLDFGTDVRAPGKDRRGVECRSLALYAKPLWYSLEKLRIDAFNVLSTMWDRLNAMLAKGALEGVDYPEDIAVRIDVLLQRRGSAKLIFKLLKPRVLAELGEGLVLKPVAYIAGFFSSLDALVPLIVARVCIECLERGSPRTNVKVIVEYDKGQRGEHIEVVMSLLNYPQLLTNKDGVVDPDILSLPGSIKADTVMLHEYSGYLVLAKSLDDLLFRIYRLRESVQRLRSLAGGEWERAGLESVEKLLESIVDEMNGLFNSAKNVEAMAAGLKKGLERKYKDVNVKIEGLEQLEETINESLSVLRDASLVEVVSEFLLRMNSVKPDVVTSILRKLVEFAKNDVPGYVASERVFSHSVAERLYEDARSIIMKALFADEENVSLRDALSASRIFRDYGDTLRLLCVSLDALSIEDRFDRRVWRQVCRVMGSVTHPLDAVVSRKSESKDNCSLAAVLAAYGISAAYALRFPGREYSVDVLRSRLKNDIYALFSTLYSGSVRRELCNCKKQWTPDSRDATSQLASLVCGCTSVQDIDAGDLEEIESLAVRLVEELKGMLSDLSSCCKGCTTECILACRAGRAAVATLYNVLREIWEELMRKQRCC